MGTDFFDDDLLKADDDSPDRFEEGDGVPVHAIADMSLTRMARQKQELSKQAVGAVTELERLKSRQEELERAREALRNLTQKQENYEAAKKDITEKLTRGAVLMEKEETHATRMAELFAETRSRFNESLEELRSIREDTWSDTNFQEELDKALVLVEEAIRTYKKAMAQIDAAGSRGTPLAKSRVDIIEDAVRAPAVPRHFGFWLKVGIALSIPFIILAICLCVVYLVFQGVI